MSAPSAVLFPAETRLIGTKEVAALLQVHERTALRFMREGLIPAFQLKRAGARRGIWRTTRVHVLHYVDLRIAQHTYHDLLSRAPPASLRPDAEA